MLKFICFDEKLIDAPEICVCVLCRVVLVKDIILIYRTLKESVKSYGMCYKRNLTVKHHKFIAIATSSKIYSINLIQSYLTMLVLYVVSWDASFSFSLPGAPVITVTMICGVLNLNRLYLF